MKKRTIALLLAVVLVIGCVVGGTIAWLTDSTTPVKNTFTTSDVDITLEESEDLDLQMIPGCTIEKDPVVTVLADSEKCWLFVQVDESTNFDDFMTYAIAEGWTAGTGTDGIPTDVYYRSVEASADNQSFGVLANDQVLVKGEVTKAQMNALEEEGATLPTLIFTAYACQAANGENEFTAAEAWAKIGA